MKTFFREWLKHRREVKVKRIEGKQTWNWSNIVLSVVCIVVVLLIGVVVVLATALHTVQAAFYKASGDVMNLVGDHPTLAAAAFAEADNDLGDDAWMVAFLTELSAQGKVQGSFRGHWTMKHERYLEKENLSCIDNFTYETLNYSLPSSEFKAANHDLIYVRGCSKFDAEAELARQMVIYDENMTRTETTKTIDEGSSVWKCPVHNCAMIEKVRTLQGAFIPESVQVNSIEASYSGVGR